MIELLNIVRYQHKYCLYFLKAFDKWFIALTKELTINSSLEYKKIRVHLY